MGKIVHICLCGSYNDNWGYQDNLIPRYNRKDGHDVTVIASVFVNSTEHEGYAEVPPRQYFLEDGVKVIRIPFRRSLGRRLAKRFRVYEGLSAILEQEKPDVLFLHGIQFWDVRRVVEYKKRNPHVRVFADNHADYLNSARSWISRYVLHGLIWRTGARRLMPLCEKVFGVTPNRCRFLVEVYGIQDDKVDLLVMGADTERIEFERRAEIRSQIRNELSVAEDDFLLVTGGKIDKHKNIDNLMQAVNSIGDPTLKLVVFGSPTAELQRTVECLSQTPFVRYVGWISASDVYKYFLAADLAVFPGRHSVLWEQAVGTGIPCIFRRWEGMRHVDVGGNCEFIERGTVNEIRDAILSLRADRVRYGRMREISSSRGVVCFSYAEIARRAAGLSKT